jgi:hypothetical protein
MRLETVNDRLKADEHAREDAHDEDGSGPSGPRHSAEETDEDRLSYIRARVGKNEPHVDKKSDRRSQARGNQGAPCNAIKVEEIPR